MRVLASEYGIVANAAGDQTDKINDAIADASAKGATLVFENGVYNVSGEVSILDQTRIEAAEVGGAVFRSWDPDNPAELTNGGYTRPTVTDGSIKGFVLDDVGIEMIGRVQKFEISSNAFINTTAQYQIHIGHGEFTVEDNVMLSGPDQDWDVSVESSSNVAGSFGPYNVGIQAYRTENTTIEGNLIGGLNSSIDDNARHSDDVVALLARVTDYDPTVDLYDSGYYTSGMSGTWNDGMAIRDNTVIGVVDAGDHFRDHAIYFRNFTDFDVQDNYFSGWPASAYGGVKIRNGERLDFSNNVLDDISLLTYAYVTGPGDIMKFNDVYIYDNEISSNGPSPIQYWENGNGSESINHQIYDNVLISNVGQAEVSINARVDDTQEGDSFGGAAVFGNVDANGQTVDVTVVRPVPVARDGSIVRTGTDGGERLNGSSRGDDLMGLGGDDTLDGRGGADTLDGGAGNDHLIATGGGNVLKGGAGDDRIDAGKAFGKDRIEGGDGDDFILGSYGDDTVDGGAGIDTYSQQVRAGSIAVEIDLNAGRAEIGASVQTLRNIENAVGAKLGDTLTGSNGANRLQGLDGDDDLFGLGGNDTLDGGNGADMLDGGAGDDVLLAGRGGGHLLRGGAGNDRIDASKAYGTDRIEGGDGDDYILGSYGDDTVDGGAGIDTYSQESRGGAVAVEIDLAAGRAEIGNSVQTLRNIENATGASRDDVLTGTNAANVLVGRDGNDRLDGLGGSDTLDGGGGNDHLIATGGGNVLKGGAGNDRIDASKAYGTDRIEGGSGDDFILGSYGGDTVDGGAGIDTYSQERRGGAAAVEIDLGAGRAEIGASVQTLRNVENATGASRDDVLTGSSAANVLDGRGGNDMLTGGAGADVFVFNRGYGDDRITDFELGTDRVDLGDGLAGRAVSFRDAGGEAVAQFAGAADELVFEGYTAAQLTADDIFI